MADTFTHPVLVKAAELAEALKQSLEFEDNDWDKQTRLIAECNMIVSVETKIRYGAISRSQGSCCG